MITLEMYFGPKPHSLEQQDAATGLLARVNRMLEEMLWHYPIDPDTGTPISGARGGAGDGGFRLATASTGATKSQHKAAHAVDVYDPMNELDESLTDEMLASHELYREAPQATVGWCHLQDVAPPSGRRTFFP